MNFSLRALSLAALLCVAHAQSNDQQDVEQVETASTDSGRDKRGFIITPLSALPAEALAPLLPYLRAVVPQPLLSKVAAFLPPTAQLVEAAEPALPRVLSATAPLVVNRAAASALPAATPVVAARQFLPAEARIVAAPAARLVAGPSNVVAASRLLVSPTPQVVAARTVLPAAPPVVPGPSFAPVARLTTAPVYPSFYPSARLTAVPLGTAPGVPTSYYTVGSPNLGLNYPVQFAQLRSSVAVPPTAAYFV